MSSPTCDSESMIVDEYCISYHGGLFQRDQGGGADLLWLRPGSGYIDIPTATAHDIEHIAPWEYSFKPEDGSLRKVDGFYRATYHDAGTFHKTVVEIPAYYVD